MTLVVDPSAFSLLQILVSFVIFFLYTDVTNFYEKKKERISCHSSAISYIYEK